jgi:hypothetical protein
MYSDKISSFDILILDKNVGNNPKTEKAGRRTLSVLGLFLDSVKTPGLTGCLNVPSRPGFFIPPPGGGEGEKNEK